MAIMVRCRRPPDSWCGICCARISGSGMEACSSRPSSAGEPLVSDLWLVRPNRFFNLRAHAHHGIQRCHRLLKNHGDLSSAHRPPFSSSPRPAKFSAPLVLRREPRSRSRGPRRQQSHQRQRKHGLPAPRFTDRPNVSPPAICSDTSLTGFTHPAAVRKFQAGERSQPRAMPPCPYHTGLVPCAHQKKRWRSTNPKLFPINANQAPLRCGHNGSARIGGDHGQSHLPSLRLGRPACGAFPMPGYKPFCARCGWNLERAEAASDTQPGSHEKFLPLVITAIWATCCFCRYRRALSG